VESQTFSLDAYRRAQFAMMDVLRRTQGNALGALGLMCFRLMGIHMPNKIYCRKRHVGSAIMVA